MQVDGGDAAAAAVFGALWINIVDINMNIQCMQPHREDVAWNHPRADERNNDPSSILELRRNEVIAGHVQRIKGGSTAVLGVKRAMGC